MSNVIWKPQPKQAIFMSRPEKEVLYGGSAGGGKSEALVIEALRQVHIPHYRAIIFRKTTPQLRELVDKSIKYYSVLYPKARYNISEHTWTFPSGAKVIFAHMQNKNSMYNYQGHAYDFIGFDEVTHFTYEEFSYLRSRNRPNGFGTLVYMRLTANPGGIGHGWVKQMFIDNNTPMTTVYEDVSYFTPEGKEVSERRSRAYIPASVFDNKKLLENDPLYIANLASLPEATKNALLYGDWNTFSGQVFMEFTNNSEHYNDRVLTHVIAPFIVPKDFKIYRSFDFGYAKPFSVGWYAVDFENRIYRIREFYGCTSEPDTGVKWEVSKIAKAILEIEKNDINLKNRYIYGVCDPAIRNRETGESVADIFEKYNLYFENGDNSRIAGKMQVHNRFAFDENGIPMFYVFNTCTHFIRTIPTLVYDTTNVEDIDTKGEDHIYDEFRYMMMTSPVNTPTKVLRKIDTRHDPLNLHTPVKYESYDYMRRY